jgi:protein O-GlcNAc transferase
MSIWAACCKPSGRWRPRRKATSRALDIKPNSAVAHSNYGSVLQHLDQLDQAEASLLRRTGNQSQSLLNAHNNLGFLFSRTNRLSESVASFERAIEIKPEYADAYANLGSILSDIGRMDEALETLRPGT